MPITLDNKIGFLSRVVESALKKKKKSQSHRVLTVTAFDKIL